MSIKFFANLVADTEAELLAVTNLEEGQLGYAKDTNKLYRWTGAVWNTSIANTIVGITGTLAEFNAALTEGDFATGGGTASGANTGDQTLAGLGGIAHSLATAVNDFLVASGAGAFVKKTLAETITILRTSLDSVYAAVLGVDDNYVTDAEKVKLSNLSGTNTGDQTLPTDATIVTTDVTTNNASTSKHGWFQKFPAPTGLYFKDDGTWGTPTAAAANQNPDLLIQATNYLLPAGYGMVVPFSYEVADGFYLEFGDGAILEIT